MSDQLLFYPGIHQPADAVHFERACISINRLERRAKPVACDEVPGDSGAFTKVNKFGGYPEAPSVYAAKVFRLWSTGVVRYRVIVAEDYMCEPFVLARTGLTVAEHQRLTVERYDLLLVALNILFDGPPPFEVMPVLQGFGVADYLTHVAMYGERLSPAMCVGVGSVCKRQGDIGVIEDLLEAIKEVRPDLRLHGFRREADSPAKPPRASLALQRRQYGVEFQRPASGPRRQRLARSHGVSSQGAATADRTGAARVVRRAVVRATS